MRTVSGDMAAHLASRSHTRAVMMLIDLHDGTSIGVTDHDRDLEFDIGDGVVTYRAGTGVFPSDIVLSEGLDADNCEVSGPIDATVTRTAVMGGRFDRARIRLFEVNWKNLAAGAVKILAGSVTYAKIEGGRFVCEARSDCDLFNQVVGATITNQCPYDYGVNDGVRSFCGATAESVVGTVGAVTSAMLFAVSYPGDAQPDDYFNFGTVTFLTGELAGTRAVEIFDWSEAGAIETYAPLVEAPAIGDTCTVKHNCGKSRAECMARGQILNFGGYPELPGSDQVMRPALPGQGNDGE